MAVSLQQEELLANAVSEYSCLYDKKAKGHKERDVLLNAWNPGGGYLTRFWTGTCHRGCKHIPVPYTNFSKMYTRLYTNLSKIYTGLYTNFPKMHTRPYTNCENFENRYRSLYQNRENRYRSLYQSRENRYPSRWHVPVPKICKVPPRGLELSFIQFLTLILPRTGV